MTTTEMPTARASDAMRNGVDTATLFATLDAVKQAPEAARFQFRARHPWRPYGGEDVQVTFPSSRSRPGKAHSGTKRAPDGRRRRAQV